jgi:hypothetical protein
VPQGHQLVLEAMQAFKQENSEKNRFETLVSRAMVIEGEAGEDPAVYLEHQV